MAGDVESRCEHPSLKVKLTPGLFYSTDTDGIRGNCIECNRLIFIEGYHFEKQATEENETYAYYER